MFEYFAAGGGLRLFQTVVYASMWIVIGCFVAAMFRRMLGPEKVKQIFANDTRFGLVAGWLIGMLLPVCSLGVIPIVRELHRCGINRGTIVAFGLTAPLFNPMSVLYGLTLSDPIAILSFSLCALVIVTLLGFVWNRMTAEVPNKPEKSSMPSAGLRRSLAVFYSAGRELVGPSMGFILLGIAGSVALATLLPHGFLQNQVERDNILAPITVAIVATPVHSTPLLAMSQIGGMFQHGNSIGAAFSMLILGAGANIGLLAWFGTTYGFKRLLVFYLLLAVTTIALAYAIDKPLIPKGVDPAGHTHAFDVYTNPFSSTSADLYDIAEQRGKDFWKKNEFGGTYLLLAMIVVGAFSFLASRIFDVEAWLLKEAKSNSSLEIVIPGWILGVVSVCGLVITSVVGCYLYYPTPEDLLNNQLSVINTDAVISAKTKQWEAAEKWIPYADDLSRRLEVGVFLRKGSVDEFQSANAKLYREKLDELKAMVDSRNETHINEKAMEVSTAYQKLREAFLDRDDR